MALRRCPFCGSKGKIIEIGYEYYPICTKKMGMCLLARRPHTGEEGFFYKKDAIKMWNKRPENE